MARTPRRLSFAAPAIIMFAAALCGGVTLSPHEGHPALPPSSGYKASYYRSSAVGLRCEIRVHAQNLRLRGGSAATITVKTLKGEVLEVEVDKEASVLDLKRKIALLQVEAYVFLCVLVRAL